MAQVNVMKQSLPARGIFLFTMTGISLLAWATLWLMGHSHWGGHLHHAGLAELGPSTSFEQLLLQAGLYVMGWVLMTTAMMLPTTIPLLEALRRMTALRPERHQLLALTVLGYLGAWLAFGVLAHFFDYGLHWLFLRSAWLQANAWLFVAGPFLLAGLFQFSKLKHRCLERCRAPAGFLVEHWRGGNPRLQALAIGTHHGLFCVGCCWALMLLMFAMGTGSLLWMLGLGMLMAIEKNFSWGRHISMPLGIVLITWAILVVIQAEYWTA